MKEQDFNELCKKAFSEQENYDDEFEDKIEEGEKEE